MRPANTIQVGLKDHSMMLVDCEGHQLKELSEYFSFFVPGHRYMPAFKRKVWDGKIRLFNQMTRELNVGLYPHLKKFALDRMYPVQLVDNDEYGHPELRNKVQHKSLVKYLDSLDAPFEIRDYQYDAISHGIENKRCLLLSPTGSGKSFIIYNLLRWYYDNHDKNMLIIVPTTSLVEQLYKDFYEIAKKGLLKGERSELFSEIKEKYICELSEEELEEKRDLISRYIKETQKKAIRDLVLNEGIRLDGRKTTDIRPIWCEVDYLPSAHGSSIFSRGETQALATATLGTSREANIIDLP